MKLLLDENLPKKLKLDFGTAHEVKTVRDTGWNGKKNGELLGLMTLNGFDRFVTMDQNLRYQQNLIRFPIIIFVLIAENNKHQTIQPLIPKLIAKIEKINLNEKLIIVS
jgi:predicted nuclease of predicted toxin-antitoxin system